MCYIMVSNGVKRAADKANVRCSFVWSNKDVCCLKLNEDVNDFIEKTKLPEFTANINDDDFINIPDGYL